MLSQHKTRRLLLLACIAAGSFGQPALAGRKLHVVIAADKNDPSIGKYCQTDGQNVSTLFSQNVHVDEVKIHHVPTSGLNEAGINATLQGAMIRPEDAVVFYYSGHGNYARDGQYYLVAGGNWTSRSAVTVALQSRGAGLVVLITDACFNFTDVDPPKKSKSYEARMAATAPLFRKLFFETNGFVDLNSCQRDEKAATHADHTLGSVFTKAFVDTLKNKSHIATATWQSIVNEISQETASQFAVLHPDGETLETGTGDFVNQRSQTVAKLAMNVFSHDPGPGAGGPGPGPGPDADLPTESSEFQIDIDARTGRTTETVITYKCFPATGQTQTLRGPTKSLGKASLIRASDNTPYWRWPRKKNPDVIFGDPTYVQAILSGGGDGMPGGNPGGPKTIANKRFGLTVSNHSGNGVMIRRVVQNGPATQCRGTDGRIWRLEAGDAITQINGQPITTVNRFANAIRVSPKLVSFTVVGRDGVLHSMTTTLDGNGNPGGPPMPNPGKGPRFGVVVAEVPGMGLVITRVVPDSPATRCFFGGQKYRLEAGDRITRVNGQKITSEASFAKAIRSSGRKMSIRVSDPSKGTHFDFTTTLNY